MTTEAARGGAQSAKVDGAAMNPYRGRDHYDDFYYRAVPFDPVSSGLPILEFSVDALYVPNRGGIDARDQVVYYDNYRLSAHAVPEPSCLALGLLGFGMLARKRGRWKDHISPSHPFIVRNRERTESPNSDLAMNDTLAMAPSIPPRSQAPAFPEVANSPASKVLPPHGGPEATRGAPRPDAPPSHRMSCRSVAGKWAILVASAVLWLSWGVRVSAQAPVDGFQMGKNSHWLQTSSVPTLTPENATSVSVDANVLCYDDGWWLPGDSAVVIGAVSGSALALTRYDYWDNIMMWQHNYAGATVFASRAELDAAFPDDSTYQFVGVPDDGSSGTIAFSALPAGTIPHFTSFEAIQTIDPSLPFRFEWTPWVGAASENAYIPFDIRRIGGESIVGVGLAREDTGYELAADSLTPGETYTVIVNFSSGRFHDGTQWDGRPIGWYYWNYRTEVTFTVPKGPPTAATLAWFRAEREGNGSVTLRWQTLVEVETLGFQLARRTASGDWLLVGSGLVPSRGQNAPGQTYEVVDLSPPGTGELFYRLIHVDLRGDSTVLAETQPTPASRDPELKLVRTGRTIQVEVSAAPGASFVLEASKQLRGDWTEIQTGACDSDGDYRVQLELTPGAPKRFYRLRAP